MLQSIFSFREGESFLIEIPGYDEPIEISVLQAGSHVKLGISKPDSINARLTYCWNVFKPIESAISIANGGPELKTEKIATWRPMCVVYGDRRPPKKLSLMDRFLEYMARKYFDRLARFD